MARQLPTDPAKRRTVYFKRIYQSLQHFKSLMESGEMPLPGIVTLPDGEEVYLADLLIGLPNLPPRQCQAFELICLQGYTETAATKIMLPNSKWSTPVQQYADTALARMISDYDVRQDGVRSDDNPPAKRPRKPRRITVVKEDTLVQDASPAVEDSFSSVLRRHLLAANDELAARRDAINQEIDKVNALLAAS